VRGAIRSSKAHRRLSKRLRRYRRRDRFFRQARAYVPYLGVAAGGTLYFASTQDKNIARGLVVKGSRKEERRLGRALELLDERLGRRARRVFVDVGANIGTTAIPARVQFGFERVIAFEPEAENFKLLRINLTANDIEDAVFAVRIALSATSGEAALVTSSANAGAYWIDGAGTERRGAQHVPLGRLDDELVAAGCAPDDVDLLWMDVEGHESHVLAGAACLLERGVPSVLEFSPRHLERAGGLERLTGQLRDWYTHVVDLRQPDSDAIPSSELDRLARRYADDFTDLLVYRLPA
jgi:FkbM family methyltransferase